MKILLFMLLCMYATDAFIFGTKKAVITPEDPYLVDGESLHLNCTIERNAVSEQELTSSQLYFELKPGKVTQNYITVYNNDSMGMEKIASLEDNGSVLCYKYKDEVQDEIEILATQHLIVDYAEIQNVTDFTCIVYDWDESLVCSWDVGKYIKPLKIKVMITVSNGYIVVSCPRDLTAAASDNSCTWQKPEFDLQPVIWILNLTVENSFRNVKRNFTRIIQEPDSIVKPNPVNRDFIQEINSTCICLHWETRVGKDISTYIQVESKWNGTLNYTLDKVNSKCLCDLVPATQHIMTIRVRPYVGEYYSNPVSAETKTKNDVPAVAPVIFPGGFFSITNNDSCTNQKLRNVIVYWQSIPEILQNGFIENYVLKYTDENGSKKEEIIASTQNRKNISLLCNSQYIINIRANNSEGLSPQATLIIAKANALFLPKDLLIETYRIENKDAIDISWKVPDSQTVIKSSTVYWCKYGSLECKGELNSVVVPRGIHNYTLTEDQAEGMDSLRIGVSVENSMFSSGIYWETCKHSKYADPQTPNVKLMDSSSENALSVQWSISQTCDNTVPYITSYKITWCKVHPERLVCDGEENMIVIGSDEAPLTYTIKNLEVSQNYGITVQAISQMKIGQRSKMVFGIPTNNDLSEGTIAGIIIGLIFASAVILAAIICFVRLKLQKWNASVSEISVPEFRNKCPDPIMTNGKTESSLMNGVDSPLLTKDNESPVNKENMYTKDPVKEGQKNGGLKVDMNRQISQDSGRGSYTSELDNALQNGYNSPLHPIEENPFKIESPNKEKLQSDYVKAGILEHVETDNETSNNNEITVMCVTRQDNDQITGSTSGNNGSLKKKSTDLKGQNSHIEGNRGQDCDYVKQTTLHHDLLLHITNSQYSPTTGINEFTLIDDSSHTEVSPEEMVVHICEEDANTCNPENANLSCVPLDKVCNSGVKSQDASGQNEDEDYIEDETKQKTNMSLSGNPDYVTDETQQKPNISSSGNLDYVTDETQQKPNISSSGNLDYVTDETQQKPNMSLSGNPDYGTDETQQKIDISLSGNLDYVTDETQHKPNMSLSGNLDYVTDETQQKTDMSLSGNPDYVTDETKQENNMSVPNDPGYVMEDTQQVANLSVSNDPGYVMEDTPIVANMSVSNDPGYVMEDTQQVANMSVSNDPGYVMEDTHQVANMSVSNDPGYVMEDTQQVANMSVSNDPGYVMEDTQQVANMSVSNDPGYVMEDTQQVANMYVSNDRGYVMEDTQQVAAMSVANKPYYFTADQKNNKKKLQKKP